MKTIHKYRLREETGIQVLIQSIYPNKVLSCADQRGFPTVWVEVDLGTFDSANLSTVQVMTVETGKEMPSVPDGLVPRFIGTCVSDGGNYVLHIYALEPLT